MRKTEMDCEKSATLPYFLTGLGVGIAVTLLLAPMTGAATRRMIGRKVKDGENWVKDTSEAAKDYVLTHGADLRDRAKDVAEVISRK